MENIHIYQTAITIVTVDSWNMRKTTINPGNDGIWILTCCSSLPLDRLVTLHTSEFRRTQAKMWVMISQLQKAWYKKRRTKQEDCQKVQLEDGWRLGRWWLGGWHCHSWAVLGSDPGCVGLACSRCACMSSVWVLWHPTTIQKHVSWASCWFCIDLRHGCV